MDAQDEFGEDSFTAGIGAEAIYEMLAAIDLERRRERTARSLPRRRRNSSPRS
jgi:DNA-directed RNA polymerase subunit beta'